MAVQMNIIPSILDSFYFGDALDIGFILKCIKSICISFVQACVIFHV